MLSKRNGAVVLQCTRVPGPMYTCVTVTLVIVLSVVVAGLLSVVAGLALCTWGLEGVEDTVVTCGIVIYCHAD